jgi:hypothetical protein
VWKRSISVELLVEICKLERRQQQGGVEGRRGRREVAVDRKPAPELPWEGVSNLRQGGDRNRETGWRERKGRERSW